MRCVPLLLLGLLLLQQGCCFEFVIDGEWEGETSHHLDHLERHKRDVSTNQEPEVVEFPQGDSVTIRSYKVESRITSRFVDTTVRSSVANSGSEGQILGFDVQIPKEAFITSFTMNVNGVTFVGTVHERATARNLFSQARAKGKAAGIIRTNSLNLDTFRTEVHVPAGSSIEFELHYQELLTRKLHFYEYSLYLRPGRLVPNFQVDVYIFEPKGISSLQQTNTFVESLSDVIKVTSTKFKAHVAFKPSLQLQKKCPDCSENAINGVLTVKYDVNREGIAGELQVSDGHFVQFFAPASLSPLPKNIVFVIDVSGSMWGVKMKQTVAAMTAILDDLNEEDQFSIVDFNHNVRCWSDELVAVNSFQISAAKEYIQSIKPNGGTNINEALMRAIHTLVKSSTSRLIDPRSVSMIILVSDGDPTVGEIKLSTIQKNVRRVMREEYSLYSLGIGFDVDYDFLERIALENRGSAQRIYANYDAAEQLRAFYKQVSSPLLRKITIDFPDGTVSDVTQNRFDKYFSGSELVVAGKVLPSEGNTLTSYTNALAFRLNLTLETETDTTELDAELAGQQHSFTGFAKQLWAYITVKQLIADRSLATTAAKKRKITQRILSLAVQHQFVTPLTSLLVVSEDGAERLLAETRRDRKHGCCPGAGIGGSSSSGQSPVTIVYQPPPWVQMTTTAPPSQVLQGPEMWGQPGKITVTSVDNDPHFIVHLPTRNMDVCFNIDSKPGHILNLVSDSGTGLAVNGQLIGAKKMNKGKLNTYFGTISVYYQPDGVSVTVSPESIAMSDGRNNHSFPWGSTTEIRQDGVRIFIVKNSRVSIKINDNIQVMVLLHRVWKKNPVSVDFLGVYIDNDNQYSPMVHGLIGQFSREPEVSVYDIHDGLDPLKKEATMEVRGIRLQVTRGWQKDYRRDSKRGSDVYCWFIHNSGKGFIDGHYTDYIVPDLHSFLPTL